MKCERKRTVIEMDPELGFEPSAKRQQRLPSLYQNDNASVVSSAYPSPIDELLAQEIDTRSSSECLSTGTDFEVANEDIPDSPNSLRPEDELLPPECDEDFENDDDDDDFEAVNEKNNYSDNITDDEDVHDIVSSSTSPCSTVSTKVSHIYDSAAIVAQITDKEFVNVNAVHHGERTPGQRLTSSKPQNSSKTSASHISQPKVKSFDEYLNTHYDDCMTPAAADPEPPRQCPLPPCHGACQESDILQHEILLLQALEWSISPVTPIGWLGVYMQLNVNNRTPASFQTSSNLGSNNNNSNNNNNNNNTKTNKTVNTKPIQKQDKQQEEQQEPASSSNLSAPSDAATRNCKVDDAFIYPQFSGLEFVQTAQLLDLCSLDVGVGNFPYSVIAAAAISHTFNRETALRCSGFDWQTLQPCARWMQPFFKVISEESHNLHLLEQNEQINTSFGLGHICPNIVTDDSHIIQTHTTTMTMFDRACLLQEQILAMETKIKQEASPATGLMCPDGLLTPPASSRKLMGIIDDDDEDDNEQTHETTN
ncbi:hypothetical protein DOY81_010732 [Sarcophaga bullata]|nr:hypothetical protein DOY81_010732 [Sarcophaga bullata]